MSYTPEQLAVIQDYFLDTRRTSIYVDEFRALLKFLHLTYDVEDAKLHDIYRSVVRVDLNTQRVSLKHEVAVHRDKDLRTLLQSAFDQVTRVRTIQDIIGYQVQKKPKHRKRQRSDGPDAAQSSKHAGSVLLRVMSFLEVTSLSIRQVKDILQKAGLSATLEFLDDGRSPFVRSGDNITKSSTASAEAVLNHEEAEMVDRMVARAFGVESVQQVALMSLTERKECVGRSCSDAEEERIDDSLVDESLAAKRRRDRAGRADTGDESGNDAVSVASGSHMELQPKSEPTGEGGTQGNPIRLSRSDLPEAQPDASCTVEAHTVPLAVSSSALLTAVAADHFRASRFIGLVSSQGHFVYANSQIQVRFSEIGVYGADGDIEHVPLGHMFHIQPRISGPMSRDFCLRVSSSSGGVMVVELLCWHDSVEQLRLSIRFRNGAHLAVVGPPKEGQSSVTVRIDTPTSVKVLRTMIVLATKRSLDLQ